MWVGCSLHTTCGWHKVIIYLASNCSFQPIGNLQCRDACSESHIYHDEMSLAVYAAPMRVAYNFVQGSACRSQSYLSRLLTPSPEVQMLDRTFHYQVSRMYKIGVSSNLPSSDTIYKPPSLYVSGKVLYLHRIGIVNTLARGLYFLACQVGIDGKLQPLKSLRKQTEAALDPKPHICQLSTF